MKKIIFIFLILLFVGCGLSAENVNNQQDTQSDIQENLGIYYPPLDNPETQVYRSLSCYAYFSLYYEGRVYSSSVGHFQAQNKSELPLEILDKELCSVYGNHNVYWSTNKDALSSYTQKGVLFKIKNYDSDYMVGIYYETENLYNLILYTHLNDIWLNNGSDLYKDRLHLDESVSISGLSMEDETVTSFINALFDATFIDPKSENLPNWEKEEHHTIYFYDAHGLSTALRIYKNGYVVKTTHKSGVDSGITYMILKIDASLCDELLNKTPE